MHALKAYDNRSGNTQWKSYTCQNFITLTKTHLPGMCLSKIKDVLNVKVHLKLRHLFNFQGRYHRTTEHNIQRIILNERQWKIPQGVFLIGRHVLSQ